MGWSFCARPFRDTKSYRNHSLPAPEEEFVKLRPLLGQHKFKADFFQQKIFHCQDRLVCYCIAVWLGFHFRNWNELFKIYQNTLKKFCGTTAVQFLNQKIITFARFKALRFSPRYEALKIGVAIFHDGLFCTASVITNIAGPMQFQIGLFWSELKAEITLPDVCSEWDRSC